MKYIIPVVFVILISACSDQGFLGEWHDDTVTMEIKQIDPVCMIELTIDGDDPFPLFTETERGVTNDGDSDWILLNNNNADVGIYLSKEHDSFIEFVGFDEYGEVTLNLTFVRSR